MDGSLLPAGESSHLLVPIINPPFADTAGVYAHPTPENKRKAEEVLAAVFGGESVEEDIQVPDMRDLPYSRTHN